MRRPYFFALIALLWIFPFSVQAVGAIADNADVVPTAHTVDSRDRACPIHCDESKTTETITAQPTDDDKDPQVGGRLVVVWVQDGDLSAWDSATSSIRTLAEGDVIPAGLTLSPDGTQLAFARATSETESLWVAATDGNTPPQQIAADLLVGWRGWADANTLYYGTLDVSNLGARPGGELFRADVAAGTVTAIDLPVDLDSAQPTLSPDGTRLLLVDPGTYGERDGTIYATSAVDPVAWEEVFRFPAVASGSHTPHFPHVHWLDADTVQTVIHPADALYNAFAADASPAVVWQVSLSDDTEPQIIAEIDAAFNGRVRWSLDSGTLQYVQRGVPPSNDKGHTVAPAVLVDLQTGETTPLGEAVIAPIWWLSDGTLLAGTVAADALIYTRIDPATNERVEWGRFPHNEIPGALLVRSGPVILSGYQGQLSINTVDGFAPQPITQFEPMVGNFTAVFIPR